MAASEPERSDCPRCIAVASYGKSGSKRLLRLLDFSPRTHCRNEPYGLRGSAFERLSGRVRACRTRAEAEAVLDEDWSEAVRVTHASMGDRDRLPSPPKVYARSLSVRLGVPRLIASKRVRRVLAIAFPTLGWEEWPAPGFVWDRERLRRSMLVLKLNHGCGVAPWAVGVAPGLRVVHVVRHPGAVLHSWAVRLLAVLDERTVTDRNRSRLVSIGEREPGWKTRFGDVASMSAHEAELWCWRYTSEVMHAAGVGRDNYMLVRDEDVAEDPTGAARRVYDFAGLEFDEQVRVQLERWAPHWRSRTSPWRELIGSEHVRIVERVLADSPMRAWWTEDQRVSRIDYQGV